MTFPGYRRPDGQVGIRNHVLVVPSTLCANHVAARIAQGLPAVALSHPFGCTFDRREDGRLVETLAGMGRNPNTAAALVVSLGCETASADVIAAGIAASGKPVERLCIQEAGGTTPAIARGRALVDLFARDAAALRPEECGLAELVLGVECGASDAFSGLSANPAVGAAADLLIAGGGTVILSEVSEMIGADHLLAARCADEETRARLRAIVAASEAELRAVDEYADGLYIAPGNIAGGLTTLEEKSLGCLHKGGTTPVREVVGYGERPSRRGLVIMDTPGQDVMSVTGMAAGGAQVICFTTGRGTPTGCPIVPVVKVCSNSETARRLADNVDIDAGAILTGAESIAAVGERILARVLAVARGERTRAEVLGHHEFAIGVQATGAAGLSRRPCG